MHTTFIRRQKNRLLEREARLCLFAEGSEKIPSPELPKPENRIVAYLRGVPVLGGIVNSIVSPLDITDEASINAMVDHGQWIDALQQANMFTLLAKPAEEFNSAVATPQALFLAMTPEQRRDVFFEYIDFFVPRQAQAELADQRSAPMDSEARVRLLGDGGILKYKRALVGIVGVDPLNADADKDARELASKALGTHFRMGVFPGTQVRGLDLQYADALKRNNFKGREPFATMPQALIDHVPPSAFRGALSLGVIDTAQLKTLNDTFLRHQQDKDVVHSQTATRLDEMGNITRKRLREEAKGVADIWRELGGFEKVALVAAGAFLMTLKPGRYAALGIAGLYAIQRFLIKSDDPAKVWSKTFNNAMNHFGKSKWFKDKKESTGYRTPNEIADPAGRAEIVAKFLDSFDRLNMESQAQGLAIMLEMPMDVFARNFQPTGPGTFALNLDASGTIDDSIRQMDPAMRKAFDEFFRVPSNRVMASEAMTYVFYQKAAEDPQNKADVEFIENVLDRLPSGSLSMLWRVDGRPEGGASHARLPHAESQSLPQNGPSVPNTAGVPNAHATPNDPAFNNDIIRAGAAYVRLVDRGRAMAVGDSMTLRTFMKKSFNFSEYTADRSTRSYTSRNRNVAGSVSDDVAASARGDRSGSAEKDVTGTVVGDVSGSPTDDASGPAIDDTSGVALDDATNAPRDDVPGSAVDNGAGNARDKVVRGPRTKPAGGAFDSSANGVNDDVSGNASDERAPRPFRRPFGTPTKDAFRGPSDNRSSNPRGPRAGTGLRSPSGSVPDDLADFAFDGAFSAPSADSSGPPRRAESGSGKDNASKAPKKSPSGSSESDASSAPRDRPRGEVKDE